MDRRPGGAVLCLLVGFALLISACTIPANANQPAESTVAAKDTPGVAVQLFTEPFAYCAAVGTVDRPDQRWGGAPLPKEIVDGYFKAVGTPSDVEIPDAFKNNTIWRCMNGQLYACNFGANLPCNSKANTDRAPTQAMADFCRQSPNSEFIPMAVTGRSTVYSWHCVNDTPEVLDQISQVDAAGFLANIWYRLAPNP